MIEITFTEMFLMLWAVAASAMAGHYYGVARHREKLLMGASLFTKKLVEDDQMRDEIRRLIKSKPDAELKFGSED
jgi:hypothetical protein